MKLDILNVEKYKICYDMNFLSYSFELIKKLIVSNL